MIEVLLVVFGAIAAKFAEGAFDAYRRRRSQRGTLVLARLPDVLRWGWDGEALLRRLISLDRQVIGDALTDEREGTVEQWAPVFMSHPESWVLLTKGPKQIVGYWHIAALDDHQFQRAKSGELLDSEIILDSVLPLDVPGTYNLYFVLLGVMPSCPAGGRRLIASFIEALEEFATNGIFFREVCANAFTRDGKRICEAFGMTPLGPHQDFGTVYHLPLDPWPARFDYKAWDKVAEQYRRAFPAAPCAAPEAGGLAGSSRNVQQAIE